MMATRPSDGARAGETESLVQDEKNIPGVGRDALKEERRPLLDLDDVEQLETELAACFDAPPPPPLNVRREDSAATASSHWNVSSQNHQHVDARYVTPPTVPAIVHRSEQRNEEEDEEQRQERLALERLREETAVTREQTQTSVSDFSSLYSPHRQVSSSQLYPAFVPATAPSSQAVRTDMGAAQARAATAPSSIVQAAAAQVSARREAVANGGDVGVAGAAAAAAAAATMGSTESSTEVVEELLSENERLRLIIEDMTEELARVSRQNRSGVTQAGPTVPLNAALPPAAMAGAARAAPQPRTLASAMAQYPGAQAEANRRRNEERERQRQQQAAGSAQDHVQQQLQQQQFGQQHQQQLRRGVFVHFKCDNCPQWLKVPGHAQLVYCPTCNHTSQMTASSTIHFPPNNALPSSEPAQPATTAGAAPGNQEQEESGFMSYFKSVWYG